MAGLPSGTYFHFAVGWVPRSHRRFPPPELGNRERAVVILLFAPTPMPRFVNDSVRISARVGKEESVRGSVASQPVKRCGIVKFFLEGSTVSRSQIQRSPGVVLTISWSGVHAENVCDHASSSEFCSDDLRLPRDAAEAGERQQRDVAG